MAEFAIQKHSAQNGLLGHSIDGDLPDVMGKMDDPMIVEPPLHAKTALCRYINRTLGRTAVDITTGNVGRTIASLLPYSWSRHDGYVRSTTVGVI